MARSFESLAGKIRRLRDNVIGTKEERAAMREALDELNALPAGPEYDQQYDRLNKAANDAIAKVPFWGQWS